MNVLSDVATAIAMTQELLHCPNCLSEDISRNGFNDRGTQSDKCRDCSRRFVLTPKFLPLSDEEIAWLECLRLERLAIAGIARVMQRSESCIQPYVNAKAKTISQKVEMTQAAWFDLSGRSTQEAWLPRLAVTDVWGIGSRWGAKLQALGIHSAADLRDADAEMIRRHFSVVVEPAFEGALLRFTNGRAIEIENRGRSG